MGKGARAVKGLKGFPKKTATSASAAEEEAPPSPTPTIKKATRASKATEVAEAKKTVTEAKKTAAEIKKEKVAKEDTPDVKDHNYPQLYDKKDKEFVATAANWREHRLFNQAIKNFDIKDPDTYPPDSLC